MGFGADNPYPHAKYNMDIRKAINIITEAQIEERFVMDRDKLDAPDVFGIVDIDALADLLNVDDRTVFFNAMRKIIVNHSEDLNDFEIFEIAHAFVNFVGLPKHTKILIAQRLATVEHYETDHGHGFDLEDEEAEAEIAPTMEPEIVDEPAEIVPDEDLPTKF